MLEGDPAENEDCQHTMRPIRPKPLRRSTVRSCNSPYPKDGAGCHSLDSYVDHLDCVCLSKRSANIDVITVVRRTEGLSPCRKRCHSEERDGVVRDGP